MNRRTRSLLACLALSALLAGCTAPAAQVSETPAPAAEVSEPTPTPTETPMPIPQFTAVIGEELLEVACGEVHPIEDDGSRVVTVEYFGGDGTDFPLDPPFDVEDTGPQSYDLKNTGYGEDAPELILYHGWETGSITWKSDPVTDRADRDYLLSIVNDTEFVPVEEPPDPRRAYVRLYLGEKTYSFFPDGTVVTDEGVGQADYCHVAALAYKYSNRNYERHIFLKARFRQMAGNDDGTVEEVTATPDCYRLCIAAPGLHVDLGLEEATELLDMLFPPDGNGFIHGTIAPWDWTPPETWLCVTEYLEGEHWALERENGAQRFWLFPDGTAAFEWFGVWDEGAWLGTVYFYGRTGLEPLTLSWNRTHLVENAFDWNELCRILEKWRDSHG